MSELWDVYHNDYRPYIGVTAPVELYKKMQAQLSRIAPSLDSADFVKHLNRYKPLDYALGDWFDRSCKIRVQKPSQTLRVVGNDTSLVGVDKIMATIDEASRETSPSWSTTIRTY